MYRNIGDMTWPAPCEEMGDLEWRLRFSRDETSKSDRMLAASIISAYRQMIVDTQQKRNMIAKELKKGPNTPIKQIQSDAEGFTPICKKCGDFGSPCEHCNT